MPAKNAAHITILKKHSEVQAQIGAGRARMYEKYPKRRGSGETPPVINTEAIFMNLLSIGAAEQVIRSVGVLATQ